MAVGGLLAVIIASLRAQRERDAARLQVQYGVARALAEAESFEDGAPRLLEAIARPLGRQVAQFWSMGDDGRLHCVAQWHEDGTDFGEFERVSREMALERGEGLPGEVWEGGRPVWLGDAVARGTFLRLKEARAADLHGGMAFLVSNGDERLGVIELFSREIRERDPELYSLIEALGRQIGEFLEALRAEQAVRVSEARKRAVLDSSLDAVITIDHEGRVVEFNRAAERLFGYAEDAAVGEELAELVIPPGLRARHREGLRRYLESGESTHRRAARGADGHAGGRRGIPDRAGREPHRGGGPADVHRNDPRHHHPPPRPAGARGGARRSSRRSSRAWPTR